MQVADIHLFATRPVPADATNVDGFDGASDAAVQWLRQSVQYGSRPDLPDLLNDLKPTSAVRDFPERGTYYAQPADMALC